MSEATGYFSVADRGTFGHWDISDGQRRVFTVRGDAETGFVLCDERKSVHNPLRSVPFATPFEALEYAARQLMGDAP